MSQTLSEQFAQAWAEKSESTSSEDETAAVAAEKAGTELAEKPEDNSLQETGDASDETSVAETAESEETEENARYTPASLAESIGWEAGDLYRALEIPLGTDLQQYLGKQSVTLGEVKDRLIEIDSGLREARELVQAHRQQYQQIAQLGAQAAQSLQASTEELDKARAWQQLIKLDYSRTDWDAVRQSGKEVAEVKQTYAVALSEAKAAVEKAEQEQQQQLGQMQQQLSQWHHQQLMQEPEFKGWDTQEKFQRGMQALSEFAVKAIGFRPEELNDVVHHKAIRALWYAYNGWQALNAQQEAGQKLRKAPKPVMRPGGGQAGPKEVARLNEIVKRGQRKGATQHDKAQAVRAALARQQMQRR
jgi:DNA-directed RNA polymerase subunit F